MMESFHARIRESRSRCLRGEGEGKCAGGGVRLSQPRTLPNPNSKWTAADRLGGTGIEVNSGARALLLAGPGEPLAHELDLPALRIPEVEELEAGAPAGPGDGRIGAAPADGGERVERVGKRVQVQRELHQRAGVEGF